uniref:Uncharacterized protein n=1 Tax=Mycena chlorophos TaxID=658473 RepID=A0ABQ0M0K0_MYCCL|nr:predicted protein [Mycena chlorophos]
MAAKRLPTAFNQLFDRDNSDLVLSRLLQAQLETALSTVTTPGQPTKTSVRQTKTKRECQRESGRSVVGGSGHTSPRGSRPEPKRQLTRRAPSTCPTCQSRDIITVLLSRAVDFLHHPWPIRSSASQIAAVRSVNYPLLIETSRKSDGALRTCARRPHGHEAREFRKGNSLLREATQWSIFAAPRTDGWAAVLGRVQVRPVLVDACEQNPQTRNPLMAAFAHLPLTNSPRPRRIGFGYYAPFLCFRFIVHLSSEERWFRCCDAPSSSRCPVPRVRVGWRTFGAVDGSAFGPSILIGAPVDCLLGFSNISASSSVSS